MTARGTIISVFSVADNAKAEPVASTRLHADARSKARPRDELLVSSGRVWEATPLLRAIGEATGVQVIFADVDAEVALGRLLHVVVADCIM